ncbi:MAG: hypothetical protein PSN04_07085 [Methyloprofundus sp.]|nr:hypothetical protein [Methyloprofundus sp.]
MFKKLAYTALLSTAILTTGCASRNASQASSPLDPGSVVGHQLEADISVGGKISGEASATVILYLFTIGDTKRAEGVNYGIGGIFSGLGASNDIKDAAAYDAVTKSSADIIVAPRYVVDVQNYFLWKEFHSSVTGYKGTITKIEQRDPACCGLGK